MKKRTITYLNLLERAFYLDEYELMVAIIMILKKKCVQLNRTVYSNSATFMTVHNNGHNVKVEMSLYNRRNEFNKFCFRML